MWILWRKQFLYNLPLSLFINFCITQNIRLSISIQKVVCLTTLGLQFDSACFGNPKEQARHPKVIKVVKKVVKYIDS